MKSVIKFCLLACIALFSIACSNSVKLTGNEFLIEGRISEVEDGVAINLYRIDGNVGISIARDTIRNGRFTFRSEVESNPELLHIMPRGVDFPSTILFVWAAPRAKIKVRGTGKLHSVWKVKSSVPYQKEANRYINKSREIHAERARNSIETKVMWSKIEASSREESLQYRKVIDSLRVIDYALTVKHLFNDIAIMEKTNISPVWLDKMKWVVVAVRYSFEYYNLDIEQAAYLRKKAEELYSRMSEEDKTTPLGYEITAYLFPPVLIAEVGGYFADVDLLDFDGNTKRIYDYLGKYLLLDFWSRGCGPCIMALPEMKEISETYRDKLTIISISLDTEAVWKGAMAEHDMPWVNIRDPKSFGGLAASYGVSGIPNYVMISPEGTIIDKWAGYGTGYLKRKVSENIGF